ncbi:MAG: hypothetical protein Fur0010_00690 [Bdellovibrio sp.]
MNKLHIFTFMTFLFINSCSHLNNSEDRTSKNIAINETVQVEKEIDSKYSPNINDGIIPTQFEITKKKRDNKVIGVILNGSGYRSFLFPDLFSGFESKGFKVHVLTGYELGAVVAALIAKYESPEKVEWVLFKLKNQLKEYSAYSKRWMKLFNSFLESEFKNDNVQDYKLVLALPYYDSKFEKLVFKKRGVVRDLLSQHLIYCESSREGKISKNVLTLEGLDIDWPILVTTEMNSPEGEVHGLNAVDWKFKGESIRDVFGFEVRGLSAYDLDKLPNYLQKNKSRISMFIEKILTESADEKNTH